MSMKKNGAQKRKLKRSITILRPALSPGQREVFEQLSHCRNFDPNPIFGQAPTGRKK